MTDKNPFRGDPFSIGILTPHLEGVPEAVQPVIQLGAKIQSEYMTLWSHRARAWIDWPEKLAACSNAADFASAQGDFVVTMQHDYAAFLDGILRDTLIEQEELVETETPEAEIKTAPEPEARPETKPLHRKAA